MKTLIAFAVVCSLMALSCSAADCYSVKATMTLDKDTGEYETAVQVAKLITRGSEQIEEVISSPRVHAKVGSPAWFFSGVDSSSTKCRGIESVNVEASWPEKEAGLAQCTVIVKRGGRVLSKYETKVSTKQ